MSYLPHRKASSDTQNDCPQLPHVTRCLLSGFKLAHTGFVHEPELTHIARPIEPFAVGWVLHDVSYLITWRPTVSASTCIEDRAGPLDDYDVVMDLGVSRSGSRSGRRRWPPRLRRCPHGQWTTSLSAETTTASMSRRHQV